MIDIKVENGKLGKLILKGNLSGLMTDLTTLVGYVYGFVDKQDHSGGEEFKRLFDQSFGESAFRDMMWSLGKLSTAITTEAHSDDAEDEEEEAAEVKVEIRDKSEFLKQLKKILDGCEGADDED